MIFQLVVNAYNWMKANDLPNWIILLFTAIVWPIVLFAFRRKKVNNIPGLEVRFAPGGMKMNGGSYRAVAIDVKHHGVAFFISCQATRVLPYRQCVPVLLQEALRHRLPSRVGDRDIGGARRRGRDIGRPSGIARIRLAERRNRPAGDACAFGSGLPRPVSEPP